MNDDLTVGPMKISPTYRGEGVREIWGGGCWERFQFPFWLAETVEAVGDATVTSSWRCRTYAFNVHDWGFFPTTDHLQLQQIGQIISSVKLRKEWQFVEDFMPKFERGWSRMWSKTYRMRPPPKSVRTTVWDEFVFSMLRSTSSVVNSPYSMMMSGIQRPVSSPKTTPRATISSSTHVAYRNYKAKPSPSEWQHRMVTNVLT